MSGAAAAFVAAGSIAITLTPTSVSGVYTGGGASNVSTSSTLVTASGGNGSYTYAWIQTGASPYTWSISAPTGSTTYFTAQALPEGTATSTTFQVTVTDSSGTSANATLTATARNKDNYSGGGLQ